MLKMIEKSYPHAKQQIKIRSKDKIRIYGFIHCLHITTLDFSREFTLLVLDRDVGRI
jgi:hypothetical protein